eukprot:TRINITY_DN3720_c0_g1_i1.p1 TRINITY_DN3720_c0_g1~~TRINITY_DN3720_c0_g1_i1.p1  ORF type:complete len:283 (-),score=50.08 TRINITY_DN3720_c0_g1_i1:438-1286(-)
MGDHLVLYVDKLITSESFKSPQQEAEAGSVSNISVKENENTVCVHIGEDGEKTPLVDSSADCKYGECRICQEEDEQKNMESPCGCSGSLKFAHRQCVQRWCNEKGSIMCEICHQTYSPGYTAPPRPAQADDNSIDMSESWGVTGAQVDLHDPRLIAIAAAERHFLDAEYDEYQAANATGTAFCRSAALILMALLFLRHALTIINVERDEDSSTFVSLFLLKAAVFLLPCYIMAWAVSILNRRRQRQEASMGGAEVTFLLRTSDGQGFQYAVSPVASVRHDLP